MSGRCIVAHQVCRVQLTEYLIYRTFRPSPYLHSRFLLAESSFIKHIQDPGEMLLILFTFMILFFGINWVTVTGCIKRAFDYSNCPEKCNLVSGCPYGVRKTASHEIS